MNATRSNKPIRINPQLLLLVRSSLHIIALTWLSIVFYRSLTGSLVGDPVQYLLDFTGISTLNLLFLSLCISPISARFKVAQLMQLRKTFGVYAALYASSHFFVFIAFELQFEWSLIISEIIKRPYISIGFIALCILCLLLFTSFNRIKKRLGSKWQKLHNWVYVALILGCVHFLWSIKSTEIEAIVYACIGIILLLIRRRKIKNIFK